MLFFYSSWSEMEWGLLGATETSQCCLFSLSVANTLPRGPGMSPGTAGEDKSESPGTTVRGIRNAFWLLQPHSKNLLLNSLLLKCCIDAMAACRWPSGSGHKLSLSWSLAGLIESKELRNNLASPEFCCVCFVVFIRFQREVNLHPNPQRELLCLIKV